MKLSFKSKQENKIKKTILFVCVENPGRSQMAEAIFRKYGPKDYDAISAGTRHTSQINPLAIEAMKEIGIDISKQKPKEMSEDMVRNATKIINMGCVDKNFCPSLFIDKVVDCGIEDPKGKSIEKVAEIRDEIERRVKEMVEEIGKGKSEE